MLARALCYTLQGVDGQPVHVETDVSGGMQVFSIVGLPDTAVRESRDRVQSALRNSGYALPIGRITVNLSPADVKKEGAVFDLPIAVSIIGASRQAAMPHLDKTLLLGELSLDGSLLPVRGVLSMVISALQQGIDQIVLPHENAPEVQSISGVCVYPARNLQQVVRHLNGTEPILCQEQLPYCASLDTLQTALDLQNGTSS